MLIHYSDSEYRNGIRQLYNVADDIQKIKSEATFPVNWSCHSKLVLRIQNNESFAKKHSFAQISKIVIFKLLSSLISPKIFSIKICQNRNDQIIVGLRMRRWKIAHSTSSSFGLIVNASPHKSCMNLRTLEFQKEHQKQTLIIIIVWEYNVVTTISVFNVSPIESWS